MRHLVMTAIAAGVIGAPAFADHHGEAALDPEAVIAGIYEAFAAGDPESFAAALHPDIVWNEAEGNTYADNNPYEGPQAVMEGVIGRVVTDWNSAARGFSHQSSSRSTVSA